MISFRMLCLLVVASFAPAGKIQSQTDGQFTLSLYTTSTGGYSPKHLVAIWIESSSPAFVKTKLLQCSGSNLDHLGLWTSRTGSNLVDATSGATLQTHGNITVNWNGTAVNGTLVPDGTYNVWVEMAWASSLTTGKTYSIFTFTKGPNTFHSSPANLTNFYNINLDWVPGTATGIEQVRLNSEVSIYPNPSGGLLNMKFRNEHSDVDIRILNESGNQVWMKSLKGLSGLDHTVDITMLPAGVYFVSFYFEDREEVLRLIKVK